MSIFRALILVTFFAMSSGCTTMTTAQKNNITVMKEQDLYIIEKSPNAAGWFGVLPGGGAFYTGRVGIGILDLLLWPISIFWDPAIGYTEAEWINYRRSYAHAEAEQTRALRALEREYEDGEINEIKYKRKKREIQDDFSFLERGKPLK